MNDATTSAHLVIWNRNDGAARSNVIRPSWAANARCTNPLMNDGGLWAAAPGLAMTPTTTQGKDIA